MNKTDEIASTLSGKREHVEKLINQLNEFTSSLCQYQPGTEVHLKSSQLREISKTITNLEGMKIPVPDELRSLKTDLLAQTHFAEDVDSLLAFVESEMAKILVVIREKRAGFSPTNGEPRTRRRTDETTPRSVLRECILKSLKSHGGRAKTSLILDDVGEMLKGHLTTLDLNHDNSNQPIWRRNTCFERRQMGKEGIISDASEAGYWELA